MSATGKVVFFTILTWLPILSFIYLPNTFWGIAIKIIAGVFLLSLLYNFTLGPGLRLYGSAGAGFILNAVWFAIINLLHSSGWISFILWVLILIGWGTCHQILKKREDGNSFDDDDLNDANLPN